MPPKPENKPSKKAVREKAANAIDEQSFGLKNKNKSKKVSQSIDPRDIVIDRSNKPFNLKYY